MIDIGDNTWVDPDSIESVQLTKVHFGEIEERLVVALRSGQRFYLPKDWTVYDLFRQMYPD